MNVSINIRDPAGRISGNLTQYRKDFSERKSMNSMVKVKGTPYEQGVMQGTELREVILHNIREVGKKMASDHVDMVRYEEFVKKNAAFLKQAHSDIFEEMKGISDGAEIPFDDILMLNIPAYFMTGYFNQECSMIMARGKATADGCTYVIKNRDMSTYIEQAVIEREYPDGLKIVEINGAGTVTYPASGMNSYGVGVTTTGFWSAKAPSDLEAAEYSHIFLNVHLLLAKCRTAREALEYVKNSPRMNGLNIIIVDREDAWLAEMTRDEVSIEKDNGSGILFRTNHYRSERLSHLNPEETEYPSTYFRYRRMEEMLGKQYGRIRFQDLFRIMSDHENGVNAICRHPQEGAPSRTISTSLFVLEDGEAWTTLGNPCDSLKYALLK